MKVLFASFQGINRRNAPQGMTKILLNVFRQWKIKSDVYYIGYDHGNLFDERIKTVSRAYHLIFLVTIAYSKIFSLVFNKKPNYGPLRLFQEKSFDYFLKFRLKQKCILVSSAAIPASFKKNSLNGGINIFIPGNACERLISDLLEEESKKYGFNLNDVYTYEKRIKFIEGSLEYVDEIVTLTKVVYNSYRNYFPNLKSTCCEFHVEVDNYIHPKVGKERKELLTFCYVAHTVWLKGLYYLVTAFKQISPSRARLLIAGGLDNQTNLLLNSENLPENIVFCGSISNLNDLYSVSDVCIIPSIIDNHPTTISESLCSGTPVITTNQCGSASLVMDYVNGFVIDPCDIETLVEKINWFLSNIDKIDEMADSALNSYQLLTNSRQNEKLAVLLEQKISSYIISN
jgi:glycosyltransferase involved in cell wall biosynthesis